ncbi:DnaD domain protein [Exiguobacterium phage vB_EauM-23]|nr:DnaD domain protein [Exiguobacterium phage vB_EauM-23]
MIQSSGNTIVDNMAQFNPTGIIIPHTWFKAIQKSGKPYMPAIVALAEIVYWYRPKVERDESSGRLIGYKKRFKADKLQKSAGGLAETFGFTKKQMTDAMSFLQKMNLIDIELRTITTGDGVRLNNVRFIEINSKKVFEITYPMTSKLQGYDPQVIGLSPVSHTNTEITYTETTNTKDSSSASPLKRVFSSYQENIYHNISGIDQQKLIDDIETFGDDMVLYAIEEAVTNNKRSYKYMEAIMRAWRQEGVKTLEEAKARTEARQNKQSNRRGGNGRAKGFKVDEQSKQDYVDNWNW